MPISEFDKTVDELVQQWFFGPQVGGNYRGTLRTRFDASPNRAEINAALSLGAYLVHSEANKQQRAALRAVMLASFLMKGVPVTQRDLLKSRYENFDLATLKRAFVSTFPALQDNDNRRAWAPVNFTPPAMLDSLRNPRAGAGPHAPLPSFQFIIHSVGNFLGAVFSTPDILTRYEVLSMSLMGNMNVQGHDPQGVILRVPENNILAAAPTDVAVLNFAPAFNPANPDAMTITDNLIEIAARTGGLQTPGYLLNHVRGYPYYNEVVVCGRAGVPLPRGVTGAMAVVGVFMLTDTQGVTRGAPDTRLAREQRVRACARTHNLPLLYIPNSMAAPGL
jgi:hypothetical protein